MWGRLERPHLGYWNAAASMLGYSRPPPAPRARVATPIPTLRTATSSAPSPRTPDAAFTTVRGGRTGTSSQVKIYSPVYIEQCATGPFIPVRGGVGLSGRRCQALVCRVICEGAVVGSAATVVPAAEEQKYSHILPRSTKPHLKNRDLRKKQRRCVMWGLGRACCSCRWPQVRPKKYFFCGGRGRRPHSGATW